MVAVIAELVSAFVCVPNIVTAENEAQEAYGCRTTPNYRKRTDPLIQDLIRRVFRFFIVGTPPTEA